ncbi:MAG: flagellar biosynthetic protein FliO, partial [Planctomycetaceae bacterium]|nr:flagellar biosynthetic protein FliO [Planctomycetaceae bacterium]
EGQAMDCNQRVAFSLFGALILFASSTHNLSAQDGRFTASPDVNTPKSITNNVPQESDKATPRHLQTIPENDGRENASPFPNVLNGRQAAERPVTPLKRNSKLPSAKGDQSTTGITERSSGGAILAVLVVLLVFALGLAKLFLKRSPYTITGLPPDAVDVLGRRTVDPRNSVYILKVGSRLILMGSSPGGLSSLAEITDPIEVASLTNVCAASKQTGPDAAKWLSKLWPKTKTVVESRPFEDQLGAQLFEEAQQDESRRVDSLTISTGRERHRAG